MAVALTLIAAMVVLLDHGSGRTGYSQRADASTHEGIIQ